MGGAPFLRRASAFQIKWHERLVLDLVKAERRAHVAHIGQARQIADEILKRRHVRGDAFEDEIHLAGERPAFAHRRPVGDAFLKRREIRLCLAWPTGPWRSRSPRRPSNLRIEQACGSP